MIVNPSNVVARMQQIISPWEAAGDRRAIFLSCYALMTGNMLAAVESGAFEDNRWVNALLHRFANYYFDALEAYERSAEGAPKVWRLTFQAARQPRTHVMQHLLLGINAHINYDMVFALNDLLAPEWAHLSPEQRTARYRDHCQVNEIIYQTIDSVQDQVVERYQASMDLVDKLLGPVDEWLTIRLITAWRDQVWDDSVGILQCASESDRQVLRHQVEQHSVERAQAILGEAGLTGWLDVI